MKTRSILSRKNLTRLLGGLLVAGTVAFSAVGLTTPRPLLAQSDGCYICQGQPYTYVKFEGKDNWDKRKKAAACGCKVGGTTSNCDAANYKILCAVK
ncbi:MAG: hypothetical protein RIF32_18195 [Leptospirales bacterium]|jgi:hypothetical protein